MKVTHLVTEIQDSPRVPLQNSRKKPSTRAKTPSSPTPSHYLSPLPLRNNPSLPRPPPPPPDSLPPPAATPISRTTTSPHPPAPIVSCGIISTPRPRQPQDQNASHSGKNPFGQSTRIRGAAPPSLTRTPRPDLGRWSEER